MISVKRIWLLTRFLFKSGALENLSMRGHNQSKRGLFGALKKRGLGSFGGQNTRGKGALSGAGPKILYVLLIAYIWYAASFMAKEVSQLLLAQNQTDLMYTMVLGTITLLILVSGLMSVISVFFLSNDRERILAMPFRMGEIVGARYLLMVLSMMLVPLIFIPPFWGTFGWLSGAGVLQYVKMLVTLILMPLAPVAVLTVAGLILGRFTPIAKNKDRFMMVTNFVMLAVVLVYVFSGMKTSGTPGQEVNAAQAYALYTGIFDSLIYIVPSLIFLNKFLILKGGAALLNLGIAILISAAFTVIAVLLADRLYGQAVRSIGQSGASKRRLSAKEMDKGIRRSSKTRALIAKEFKLVTRSPIILMNNVIGGLIPVFMVVIVSVMSLLNNPKQLDLGQIRQIIGAFLNSPETPRGLVLAGVGLGVSILAHTMLGISGLGTSTFSREGKSIVYMRLLPVSLRRQLFAKMVLTLAFSLLPLLVILLAGGLVLGLPWWFMLSMLGVYLISGVNANLVTVLFDVSMPKLLWDNEVYAVKQNPVCFLSMLCSWALAGLYGLMIYLITRFKWYMHDWTVIAIAFVLPLLILLILSVLTDRMAHRTMRHLERRL